MTKPFIIKPALNSVLLTIKQNKYAFIVLILLTGLNSYLFSYGIYWLNILPFVFLVTWAIIYRTDIAFLFVAFSTPISVIEYFKDFGLSINLPSEPVLMLMMCLFYFKLLLDGGYDKSILKHPFTKIIFFNLAWVLVTACTSEMFLGSIKFFLSRLWFVTVAYLIGTTIFRKISYIKWFVIASVIPLSYVVIYTLYREYLNDWYQNYANYASNPYFTGHGVYAAILSLFLPFLFLFAMFPKTFHLPRWLVILSGFLFLLFTFGIIMSYARAAWIGIVAALGFMAILLLKIRPWMIGWGSLVIVIIALLTWNTFYDKLKENKKVSDSDLSQHIASISNVSTDASNTERINRWNCAFRMFNQRPVFGWGPGTYMFQYAPFQRANEKTIISTNTGSLGNAHSEYIGPLAESGVLGSISILIIVLYSLYKSMMLYYYSKNRFSRLVAFAVGIAFVTYYVHGIMNNYLDTDKASVPLWAFTAILVIIDIKFGKMDESQIEEAWQAGGMKISWKL
ncbi:MAG: O-antigen ligase family protein [Bacteroidetes bacterium]|nr:O-antigen ligase family protein [Bacteroidota bacterium]